MMSRDSPNKTIPSIATPTVPIPVQIAYAVPTGISFIAIDKNQKLMVIATMVKADGPSLEKPLVYFIPIAQPHSNRPATTR